MMDMEIGRKLRPGDKHYKESQPSKEPDFEKQKNPRKGKILYSAWLTETEVSEIQRAFEEFDTGQLFISLQKIKDRGDLFKK